MVKTRLTPEMIQAASMDAGNSSMREAGRTRWNREDASACAAENARLYAILDAAGICFCGCQR